jgi:hypothetical protein
MNRRDALRLAPGDVICFGCDSRSVNPSYLGRVKHVTAKGGILVDRLAVSARNYVRGTDAARVSAGEEWLPYSRVIWADKCGARPRRDGKAAA